MAAALSRRGTGLCCIQRELCRVVWRPQTALFSSKSWDRKPPPRRTHIKKAKPQPAVDIAKLLEQLFNQRRPGTAPPVARPTKPPTASSMNVSASNVPPLSKTEPDASSFKQVDARSLSSVAVATTLASEAAAVECRTSMETIETSVETSTRQPLSDHEVEETLSFPAASVEPLIETTIESPVEHILSHPVEPSVEAPAEEVQTKITGVSYSAKVEPLIETTVELPVEANQFTVGTVETRAAVAEGPVEPPIDVAAREVETESTDSGGVDVSHTPTVEPLIETTVEPASEKCPPLLETLENTSAVAEGSVEATIEADTAALSVQTNSTDSGPVTLLHAAEEEPLIETTIEPPVEASHSTLGTIETRAAAVEGPVEPPIDVTVDLAAQKVETKSTDSGPVHLSCAAEEEPLIETTTEPAVEASPVCEGTIEPAMETESGDDLSHAALIQNAEASAALTLQNKPTIESTVESVSAAVEEEGNRSEEMTLESVTLHMDQLLVASFKTDELLQTISVLDEKAEKRVRELSVQTEIGAESSGEDEREILTDVLSKWDSLSEDLREFEGESGTLVEELFCHAPPTPRSVSTSPAAGAEAVTLESITLAEAEVGGLEIEDLRETRNALEEEAATPAKEETVEVGTTIDEETVVEETAEADFLTLDSISEAMSLESVTLAEVEASLGTLEKESLSETTNFLEEAAEIVAGEQRTEVEDVAPPEETPEAPSLAEDLQMEALIEELLFSFPAPVAGDQIGLETVRSDTSDAAVAAGPVDAAPEVTDDLEEEEAEALGKEDGQAGLDPVQRLFLEKMKEYNNMRRLNGGLLEAEPDYEKYLSEETAKLRRLYGGGDLSSFPQFTFTEPQLDQDSK